MMGVSTDNMVVAQQLSALSSRSPSRHNIDNDEKDAKYIVKSVRERVPIQEPMS